MMLQTQSILSGNYSSDDSYAKRDFLHDDNINSEEIEETDIGRKLVLNAECGMYFVSLNRIIRIESSNNYCFVHLISGQSLFISKPLKSFEISLQNSGFYRIHNSHLINLHYLES